MTILVTGINGFIGSRIAGILVAKGERVRGTVRPSSNLSNLADIRDKVELSCGDIRDEAFLQKTFNGVSVCFHAAALVRSGRFGKEEYFSTNLSGTINVCKAAINAGVKRFIYTSTCETLRPARPCDQTIITENIRNSYRDMISPYSQSKFLAEEHVKSCVTQGLPAVILNPTAVLGPGDINIAPPTKLVLTYLKGRIPLYFKTGFNVVDVRDAASAHILAVEHGEIGERYIIGNSNVWLKQFFAVLNEVSGKKPFSGCIPYFFFKYGAKIFIKNPVWRKRVIASENPFFLDHARAEKTLNWKPNFDLKTTLKNTWEFLCLQH